MAPFFRHMAVAAVTCLAGFAASAAGDSVLAPIELAIELDIVFPRNETYTQPDVVPIAVAVQNLTSAALGRLKIAWAIERVEDDGNRGTGASVDRNQFALPDSAPEHSGGDPVLLVDATNATQWIDDVDPDERLLLALYLFWDDMEVDHCMLGWNTATLMFTILPEGVSNRSSQYNASAIPLSVADAPACPVFGLGAAVLDETYTEAATTPTATATATAPATATSGASASSSTPFVCSQVYSFNSNAAAGTPCAVTIDAAAGSSIASRATSMAAAVYSSYHAPLITPTFRNTNGVPAATNAARAPALAAAAAAAYLAYA